MESRVQRASESAVLISVLSDLYIPEAKGFIGCLNFLFTGRPKKKKKKKIQKSQAQYRLFKKVVKEYPGGSMG